MAPQKSEVIIRELLERADVEVNGKTPGTYRYTIQNYTAVFCRKLPLGWENPIWTAGGIARPSMS